MSLVPPKQQTRVAGSQQETEASTASNEPQDLTSRPSNMECTAADGMMQTVANENPTPEVSQKDTEPVSSNEDNLAGDSIAKEYEDVQSPPVTVAVDKAKELEMAISNPPQPEKRDAGNDDYADKIAEEPMFQFLSGQQMLELKEIRARQVLDAVPQARRASIDPKEDALCYVFVSHRWEEPQNPDASGIQLQTMHRWLRLVEELILGTNPKMVDHELTWPDALDQMTNGMPQAASLVSRIFKQHKDHISNERLQEMLQNPLQHIWLFYDCACLPQKFVKGGRTNEDCIEFKRALQHLDTLVGKCELLCLRIPEDEYFHRAWCSFEHFRKSLDGFQRDITLDCTEFLKMTKTDWYMDEDKEAAIAEEDANKTIESLMASMAQIQQAMALLQKQKQSNVNKRVNETMSESRRVQFDVIQQAWSFVVQDAKEKRTNIQIPDLCKEQHRIRSYRQKTETPPMHDAMQQLVMELHFAIFSLSCRDAAELAGIPEPEENHLCVPNVGVQCGLHHKPQRNEESMAESRDRFRQGIDSSMVDFQIAVGELREDDAFRPLCPIGHPLHPAVCQGGLRCDSKECKSPTRVIGKNSIHVGCVQCNYDICYNCVVPPEQKSDKKERAPEQAWEEVMKVCRAVPLDADAGGTKEEGSLCERRVTIDLCRITSSIFGRYGQRCTNNGDVAFVGLLALKNLLCGESVAEKADRKALKLSSGPLSFLKDLLEAAIARYSSVLAMGDTVASLLATVVMKLPKWVLLDMANAPTNTCVNLLLEDSLSFGKKAQQYMAENPDFVSFSFNVSTPPIQYKVCSKDPSCHSHGWFFCQHWVQAKLLRFACSLFKAPSTLDPWTTIELPTGLAGFGTAVVANQLYVTGGAYGDADPKTNDFLSCSDHIYKTNLPLSADTVWTRSSINLLRARRGHGICVRKDSSGQPMALIVGGGRATTVVGKEAEPLFSSEIFRLDETGDIVEGEEGPALSHSNHHFASVGDCLFAFGGSTQDPSDFHCDIYDFSSESWKEGPKIGFGFRGGSFVLTEDRFAWIFGGVHIDKQGNATGMSKNCMVLDLQAWVEWINGKQGEESRPSSSWIPLPHLPFGGSPAPNACHSVDGGWIILAGPFPTGNVCFGLNLNGKDPTTSSFEWVQLGGTPEMTALGSCVVANGVLAIIGGTDSTNEVTKTIYIRQLSSGPRGLVPVGHLDSMANPQGQLMEHARLVVNEHYLASRLGLPVHEEDLIAADGIKRVLVLLPGDHCQRCLSRTGSLELSKCDAVMYGVRGPGLSRRIRLCSACLCSLYM